MELYQGSWLAWKVHDNYTTSDLYYDHETGVYVGRRLQGVGYSVIEWLVASKGIDGLVAGPRPPHRFTMMEFGGR